MVQVGAGKSAKERTRPDGRKARRAPRLPLSVGKRRETGYFVFEAPPAPFEALVFSILVATI